MALGTPVHRAANGGTGAVITTPAFTPAAGSLLLAAVGMRWDTYPIPAPTITSSPALTWTLVATELAPDLDLVKQRISIWRAIATGVSMTVTSTKTGTARSQLVVTEFPGGMGAVTNFDIDDDPDGDPSATLPTTPGGASLSYAFSCFIGTDLATVGPPSGYTQLYEVLQTNMPINSSYKTPAQAAAAWTTTPNNPAMGAVVEILPLGITRAGFIWFS